MGHLTRPKEAYRKGRGLSYTRTVTPASWLFVKGDQSIWIERPHGCSMVVAGPGAVREQHDFPDEAALQGYQMAIADKLATAGWLLWGVNRQRRAQAERRRMTRPASDRRARGSGAPGSASDAGS